MKIYIYIAIPLVLALVLFLAWKYKPVRINKNYFYDAWKKLQLNLKVKKTWPIAINEADKLLDQALKQKHFKGRTMGERLVSAQRIFSDNDSVWFGHKLNSKLIINPTMKLTKTDTKEALLGFRKALQDLGALPNGKTK